MFGGNIMKYKKEYKILKLLWNMLYKKNGNLETNQNWLILLSNCAICGKRKSAFIKNQKLSSD